MALFQRLNSLEGLPRILDEIWHRCLDDQPDQNEQREIEEALKSIEAGMIRLQEILTEGRKKRIKGSTGRTVSGKVHSRWPPNVIGEENEKGNPKSYLRTLRQRGFNTGK